MTLYISPYRRMAAMREMMNRMFEDSLTETAAPAREMLLAVDVKASDEAYDLTALVPGLNADDVNIEVINNTIALRGEFKSSLEEDSKYLMSELPAGRFSRVITLPTALEPSKAEASIKDGVLRLHVPKAEAHRPKSIKVLAG
ncbi:MAG: Hsp20/alpha crystallin family protein [Chloroflexi bacterium]|nr:Hsp20/alpha crystallin family protein [Chloroflexota bacterium]